MTLKPTSSQGSGGGGSGTVTSVSSADTSVAVATGTTTPVLTVAALNTIAGNHATSGSVAMNSNKLTGLAAGSGAGDSLRYEQVIGSNVLAVSNLGAGTAGQVLGGTGPTYALPPGYEFDYVQRTTNVTVTNTVTAVVDGNAVTYDGSTRIRLEFYASVAEITGSASASVSLALYVYDGSTQGAEIAGISVSALSDTQDFPCYGAIFLTPSAGSHTFHVKGQRGTPGSALVAAGDGLTGDFAPSFMRITKA